MINQNIDKGKAFDWGKASKDYALYRDIYPQEFYQRMLDFGLGIKGQRVLDLGTGTGVIPRNLCRYGAEFVGVDIAEPQIAEAKRLSAENHMNITYFCTPVEEVQFSPDSFDAVTACQCFFYFDTAKLLPVLKNILKPGGRLGILFMAWLPEESKIAKCSEELVLRFNPDWTGANMKRNLFKIPEWAGTFAFTPVHNIGFDIDIEFTKSSWNGRMLACRGVGASLTPEETAAFEVSHLKMLDTLTDEETFKIPHYAKMLILRNDK